MVARFCTTLYPLTSLPDSTLEKIIDPGPVPPLLLEPFHHPCSLREHDTHITPQLQQSTHECTPLAYGG